MLSEPDPPVRYGWSRRRLEPLVLTENCGYKGTTTKFCTPSASIADRASSVKGYQYRMPTYVDTVMLWRVWSLDWTRVAWAVVYFTMGEPPPMEL